MTIPAIELAILSELIDTIYQGATDPTNWNVALPAIADWIGASNGVLFTPLHSPENGGFYFAHAIPESVMQLWWARYSAEDLWTKRLIELGLSYEGNIAIGDEFVPFEELSHTHNYRDFLSKHDLTHLLRCIVSGVNPQLVSCALLRGHKAGPFSADERDRLALLVPHISRALGVMRRLRDMEFKVASSLNALDHLNTAVLLFGARGQVAFANRAARHLLEEEDGLRLRNLVGNSSYGELVADESETHSALVNAIVNAISLDILHTEHFSHAIKVPRLSGRQAYTLNFSSLAVQNEFGSGADAPRAIAFITDNAQPIQLNEELLKKTYSLTPAEIRLLGMMGESLTIEEAADRLGLSSHTVRTQLKSIYTKTNVNNRAKLMRLIMGLSQANL